MDFKQAVSAYMDVAKGRRETSGVKPSPSRSNEARGIWFLRDRKGEQVARVSKSGVRLAGSNRFSRPKHAIGHKRARA